MEPQDLRIGNNVYWNRKEENLPLQEVEIYNILRGTVRAYTHTELDEVQLHYSDIEGIPLSPSWLERLGFRQIEKYWSNDAEPFLRIANLFGAWHCSLGDDDSGTAFRVIKSVHELQNVWNALTGKELELTLNTEEK